MGSNDFLKGDATGITASIEHVADVLVIGGGPAGAWAAISAAARGAKVVLADKGFCGTSGATAPSGTGLWHVPRDTAAREKAKASRFTMGGFLAEHAWMDRVLEQTWLNVETLTEWGYPFPVDEHGSLRRTSLQGPEYMRLMRKQVKQAGVCILDHSPVLELLVDEHGAISGASGVNRQTGDTWLARVGAVVIASGACAFLSHALGCNVLTGDGQLMAAEVGAQLSGMEFSNAYGLGPAFSSVTKSLFYTWATFYDKDRKPIEGAGSSRGRSIIARELQTQAVYACLDRAATPQDAVKAREAAAMLATSRWMYRSALQRTETRGMHRRRDHPGVDPLQQYRLLSGGLDEVWTATDKVDNPASVVPASAASVSSTPTTTPAIQDKERLAA